MSKKANRALEDIIKFIGGFLILMLTVFFIADKTKFWIMLGVIAVVLLFAAIKFYGHIFTRHDKSTWVARKLHKALRKKGVNCESEYYDGHKHIDIYIPEAKLAIEVDGNQHYTNPEQIRSDLKRVKFSLRNGVRTFHVPNNVVINNLKKVTEAIVEISGRSSD